MLVIGSCREAAAQNADHFRALKLLGSALYALGDFEGARHELQQALQLQPDYADALCDLGCTFCALGQTGNARKAFSDALLVAPDHLEVSQHDLKRLPQCLHLKKPLPEFLSVSDLIR